MGLRRICCWINCSVVLTNLGLRLRFRLVHQISFSRLGRIFFQMRTEGTCTIVVS
ncbi:hypothetical protein KC19_5G164100 [Ceratodon purpureus]|uniref:Uncharacterized protein n=1 Tax=Ceratodon purpureus TaxID=3225 RepID=A0A8T0I3N0_CERPU|nr:hypothetical protein KC19_5G164100 [Ceratodon purpureus]